jgi:uncharacterized protein (TIGR00297 family)
MINFLLGLTGSFLIAYPAYLKQKLSKSGLLGSLILGTFIFGFGTGLLWTVMILFFISSTLISKKSSRKEEKRGRTIVQVFANGGVALFFASLYYFSNVEAWLLIALLTFAGSTADTWGSEIGTALKGKTFYITTLQQVPPGMSGGVSFAGTLASILGSLFIATSIIIYKIITGTPFSFYGNPFQEWLLILGMGFLTAILDSYFGALIQAKYQNGADQNITEIKTTQAKLIAGLSFINNDGVNLLSTLIVGIIATFFLVF